MKVALISVDPFSPVLKLEISSFPAIIGRDHRADVRVEARAVSDRHCMLLERGGVLTVRDLKSEHGLLVNGALQSSTTLSPDDTLTIGIRVFRVCYGEVETAGDKKPLGGKPATGEKVTRRRKSAARRSAEEGERGRVSV